MKIQKAAGTRRKRGGENLRFSPGNWAHAQFLMNGMSPSGGGQGAEKTCGFLPGIRHMPNPSQIQRRRSGGRKGKKKWKK